MANQHRWSFFRAGDFDQVKLRTGDDLMNIESLDQKLWVALACPTSGLEIDARTLSLIDTDQDGRVRAAELIAAVKFAGANLKDPDDLTRGRDTLSLAAINDATPEGATLLSSARQILANIGKADASAISIEDVADPVRIFAGSAFNGDGVITEVSAADEPARALIRDIIDCVGGVPDRSGAVGIGADAIEAFFAEAQAYGDWYAAGEAAGAAVFPLGAERSAKAVAAVVAARPKVDDYFGRCRLAAYDPRALQSLNRAEDEYLAIAAQDMTITAAEVAGFPLAQVGANKPLPLSGPVNPAHAAALAALRDDAVTPLLGPRAQLTEEDWAALGAKLAGYEAWGAAKPDQRVEQLGEKRIREILASGLGDVLRGLVAKDKALEAEANSVEQVERLVRYHRDIHRLCTNFVSFEDFYDGGSPAVFQCGTLYLDQRACRLCLKVEDPAKHAVMAGMAGAYLAYLDCARKATGEKMQVVAAVTAGDSDNLMVGRNGLFYDRQGRDWDATITKIVDNPISIRQAFWSPYKKFVRFLEEQVAKRAAAGDADSQSMLSAAATATAHVGSAKPPEAKKVDVGTVAALGVAVGAIGAFITALVGYATGIFKLGVIATALALIGLVLLISLPSVVLAAIKLRKRNLGPILDANGWAVNARARINVPFGATLSSVARLPPGARRETGDRYAERGFPWKTILFLLLLVYVGYRWYRGSLDRVLPERLRSTDVLGDWAPAPKADGH
jgi:hypothetical protein